MWKYLLFLLNVEPLILAAHRVAMFWQNGHKEGADYLPTHQLRMLSVKNKHHKSVREGQSPFITAFVNSFGGKKINPVAG